MPAELKILRDVASYRLRRLEMANLAAACAIMLALRLSASEIAVRTAFGALLNLLVYLNNDWCDREEDADAAGREHDKTAYLRAHPAAAVRAQLGLVAVLAAIATAWGGGLWWPLLLGGGICWAYSSVLKRRPVLDVLAMIVWGLAMPWVGVPPGFDAGIALLVQLALFSGVFETIQVVRDHEDDRKKGIRTTAVVLGPDLTRFVTRGLCVAAAIWAALQFHPGFAVPAVIAALLPMHAADPTRTWNRVRMLFGITLLAECAWVWAGGGA